LAIQFDGKASKKWEQVAKSGPEDATHLRCCTHILRCDRADDRPTKDVIIRVVCHDLIKILAFGIFNGLGKYIELGGFIIFQHI